MSLRDICKERILNDMIRTVNSDGSWKAFVVDHDSMRIISACCKMTDITDENIMIVEKIDIQRQAIPNLDAIYFLTPKSESVDLFINDFKKKDKVMYAAAHLFFTSKLPDSEFQKISSSPAALKIKTLKELNIEFLPYEGQAFHFDSDDAMVTFFNPESVNAPIEQVRIANKLVTLCATLNELPVIRYSKSHPLSASLANAVQARLDNLARNAAGWTPNEERATLLIVDRTVDPVAPLLHEFTYQAMIYDLLDIDNDRYTFNYTSNSGVSSKKEVILGESDPLWVGLRHKHIADTINLVIDNFNNFVTNNKASKLTNGKQIETLKDMSEAMRAMPQYTEMLSKYTLHINLAGSVMDVFNNSALESLARIEQDMATGEDADGKTVKNVISSLPPILADPNLSKEDKMRLLMIYIISQEGIKEQDRKRLMDLAKISNQEQVAIANLFYLGVTLNKAAKGHKKKDSKKKKKARGEDVPYELSRFSPNMKEIFTELVNDSLNLEQYPFLREDPSAVRERASSSSAPVKTSLKGAKQPHKWVDKGKKKEEPKATFNGPRLIVFIAGGMTLSEMRSAYEVSEQTNRMCMIGSTHIITPKKFLGDLGKLKQLN